MMALSMSTLLASASTTTGLRAMHTHTYVHSLQHTN